MKFLCLADLHYFSKWDPYYNYILNNLIKDVNPDYILIAGDIIESYLVKTSENVYKTIREKLFSEFGFCPYYYTIDLVIYIAYTESLEFKQLLDSVPECACSSDLYFFTRNWAKVYDKETMKESNKHNFVYKISYKDPIFHSNCGLTYGEYLAQSNAGAN